MSTQQDLQDADQQRREINAGITVYVNPSVPGFQGVLKQRYTDFLVNEVLPNGHVVHLERLQAGKRKRGDINEEEEEERDRAKAAKSENIKSVDDGSRQESDAANDTTESAWISDDSRARLRMIFGDETLTAILSLHEHLLKFPHKKAKDVRPVKSSSINDKQLRTEGHQAIRDIFKSKLDSKTMDDSSINITAAPGVQKERGSNDSRAPIVKNKLDWANLGGEYVHFTLYKENKDTMEAISFLASQLKVNPRSFQFGGTKDRRAVTAQRVSCYRIRPEQLASVGQRLRSSKVGDFEHHPAGLELGDLGGNEFCITLRDCHFPGEEGLTFDERLELARRVVNDSAQQFRDGGFINYYGLQRFGSFAASTDEIGTKMLQGDLGGAVTDILHFNSEALNAAQDSNNPGILIASDDQARARAIDKWNKTHDANAALAVLPKKFSAELNLIRFLGSNHRKGNLKVDAPLKDSLRLNDFQGALMTIPRNLRLMYVHAYQSLVWNVVAGKRWELYGPQVVSGDLVLVREHRSKEKNASNLESEDAEVDEDGEPIVRPAAGDSAATATDDMFERARPLTSAEAESGLYSIFDVVLPLPGHDILYPNNETEAAYKEFMASERGGGLDPYNMQRSWKEISLAGGYRKLIARAKMQDWEVKGYRGKDTQLVETDLERLQRLGLVEDGGGSDNRNANGRSEATANGEERDKGEEEEVDRIAVVLKMQLGPGQYATMALRELMKAGGVRTFKPDFGAAR